MEIWTDLKKDNYEEVEGKGKDFRPTVDTSQQQA